MPTFFHIKSKAINHSTPDKAVRANIEQRSIGGERIAHLVVKAIRLQLQTWGDRGLPSLEPWHHLADGWAEQY
jgi:hypothetical protein